MSLLRPTLVTFAGLTILLGLGYPAAVTGLGRLCFPWRAGGSLIHVDGQLRGSALIGQHSEDPRYFWGRLSATGDYPTWCRTCCGWGLFRAPEDDDEVDPPELLWPESIRWRESA